MTSSKPYLLRALHQWIVDNGLTPHLIVDAEAGAVQVPEQAIEDGRLVLNVSPSATRGLALENDAVSFQARFSGVAREIWLPMAAVMAIYARENGQGMMFAELGDNDTDPPDGEPRAEKPSGPKLRVIK
jgi:stringent starvation protein B